MKKCIHCNVEKEIENFKSINRKGCIECNNTKYRQNRKDKFNLISLKERTRECPNCGKHIVYSNLYCKHNAENKKSLCKSCGIKLSCQRPEILKAMSERVTGKNNPMFGKISTFYQRKHKPETIKKLSEQRIGIPCTEQRKESLRKYASNHPNPMKGRSVYSVWLKKYGKEIADIKMVEYKRKQSALNSGKNNCMFGKPSPQGAGNGWKGWYKDIYFRSLRELSYMIYLDENNIIWESAESKKFIIPYICPLGRSRTYRPDFLINNNTLIELKPQKMQETPLIKLKTKAALEWCLNNNYKYEIFDFPISSMAIKMQLDIGNIKFDRNYQEKFLLYLQNN